MIEADLEQGRAARGERGVEPGDLGGDLGEGEDAAPPEGPSDVARRHSTRRTR